MRRLHRLLGLVVTLPLMAGCGTVEVGDGAPGGGPPGGGGNAGGACNVQRDYAYKGCVDDEVFWFDNCDNRSDPVENCGDGGEICADATCVPAGGGGPRGNPDGGNGGPDGGGGPTDPCADGFFGGPAADEQCTCEAGLVNCFSDEDDDKITGPNGIVLTCSALKPDGKFTGGRLLCSDCQLDESECQ